MSIETNPINIMTEPGFSISRKSMYKKPIKKDNYKVEPELEETAQEVRRRQLLAHQKERRETVFNAARALVEQVLISEEENEEPMEVEKLENTCRKQKYNRNYANKLMMSEWMVGVPEDLASKWSMVPCPKGRRNLLVASRGSTVAYSRRGEKITEFKSALPGGNPDEMTRSCTLLDCIWVQKEAVYYVLDVLAWSTQPFLNCDAEFRRFWLESKLSETEDLKCRRTKRNDYPILALPSVPCNEDLSDFIEKLALPPLDGLLFYHREGYYMHGFTPLVTWLKTYMLPEVLGVAVPSAMEEKPAGYVDLFQHIAGAKRKQRLKSELPMETSNG